MRAYRLRSKHTARAQARCGHAFCPPRLSLSLTLAPPLAPSGSPAGPGKPASAIQRWCRRTCRRGGSSGGSGGAGHAAPAAHRRDVACRRAVQHRPAGASRVDHRGPGDVHHLLHQPQVSHRGAVRPSVRVRRLLGPDARVPRLPRSCADVDAGTGGVRRSSGGQELRPRCSVWTLINRTSSPQCRTKVV